MRADRRMLVIGLTAVWSTSVLFALTGYYAATSSVDIRQSYQTAHAGLRTGAAAAGGGDGWGALRSTADVAVDAASMASRHREASLRSQQQLAATMEAVDAAEAPHAAAAGAGRASVDGDADLDAALAEHHHRAATFGGVQALTLPLKIDGCLDAVLYGFAKCMRKQTKGGPAVHWRIILAWHHTGAAYRGGDKKKETVHGMWQFGPGDCPMPEFYLHTNASAPRHTLKVLVAGGLDPTLLQVIVPPADEYALAAPGSPYSWPLAAHCVTDRAPPKAVRPVLPRTNYVLLAVRPTPGGFSYAEYARVLELFVAHHTALGFDRVVAYYDSAHLVHLGREPAFAQLAAGGRLSTVLWDFTPRVTGQASTWGAQAFAISHAFLAMWGRDVGMLSVDLDEWLYLAPGLGGLPGAWARCWNRAPCVEIPRLTTFCAGCGPRDLSVWGGRDPMSRYTLVASKTGPGFKAVEYVKPYAASWRVHATSIHFVYGCKQLAADRSCSALVHMINLWVHRFEPNMTDAFRFDRATLNLTKLAPSSPKQRKRKKGAKAKRKRP